MAEGIQRRRTKGFRMPPGAVYVGRPGYWRNIFVVGQPIPEVYGGGEVRDQAHAVELFREYLARNPVIVADARRQLVGRDLACWCPVGTPCHRDVLLEVANEEARRG